MRRALHSQRGAVLVETTLVAGMILTMLLFSVQVGILGFLQVTADAASFVDAHLHSVGTVAKGANVEAATSGALPQVAPGDITTTPVPAPAANVPVDYGYNGKTKAEIAASGSTRFGGVSMLQPTLVQTNVNPHEVLNIVGNKIGVDAQHVEPQWEECGSHYNVTNASNLTCGSGAAGGFQVDYFNGGENTPPYYVGFNYVKHCQDQQPWMACSGSGAQPGIDFIAFGQAEFLDAHNSGRAQPGISGGCDLATFYEAAYHQRVYSKVAQFFAAYGSLGDLYATYGGDAKTPNSVFGTIAGKSPISDFTNWHEFESAGKGAGPTVDEAIRTIYNWDEHVAQGYTYTATSQPGTYPLNPDGGCG